MNKMEVADRNYIANELCDHLIARQETTTSCLTFSSRRLAGHGTWQKRVRKEVWSLTVVDDGMPQQAEWDALANLYAVVIETLRVHPVASG